MESRSFWEQLYSSATTDEFPSSGRADAVLVELVESELRPPAAVLDLGCGGGRNAVHLARAGFEVTGVDISEPALSLCRSVFEREGLPGRFLQGAMQSIPGPDRSFRAVFCLNALDHVMLSEARQSLQEITRVLVPGGWCLLTFDPVDTDEDRLDEAEVLGDGTLRFVRGSRAGMLFRRYLDEEIRALCASMSVLRFETRPSGVRAVVARSNWSPP